MFPTTDQGRIDHLQLIITMTYLDLQHGNPVMQDTFERVECCHGNLTVRSQGVLDAEHLLAVRRKPFQNALHGLIHLCRDFWLLQQRLARREGTLERLLFFREPGQNPLPVGSRADVWFGFAQRLIEGERAAIEAGFTPLLQPDLGCLSHALDLAEDLQQPYLLAKSRLSQARRVLAQARADADLALRGQAFALRWLFRDKVQLVRAMRRYGFRRKLTPASSQPEPEFQEGSATPKQQASEPALRDESPPLRLAHPLPALHLVPFALSGLQAAVTASNRPVSSLNSSPPVVPVQVDTPLHHQARAP